MKKIYSLLLLLIALAATNARAQHGEYVGGDISILPLYEASGNIYLDKDGNKISDLITWLNAECGWNTFRVRLFVNPKKQNAKGAFDPAVCQDIEYVKALGKRIKDAGCKFMLDFHYSDTWVDAGSIQAPAICNSMTADEKATWIYSYTKESLEALSAAGATPDLVQVGNEIMYGFMGIKVAPYEQSGTDWTSFLKVLKQGCQAVRDVLPQSQIIIHTDRPTNSDYIKYWYGKLDTAGVPYDVIGLSYYPFWHGWLTKAQKSGTNNSIEASFDVLATAFPTKKVQIVETAYNFQYWPTSGVNYDTRSVWACSEDGQYSFISDLVTELAKHENVNALMYWCPEEAGNGDNANWDTKEGIVIDSWLNRGLWWPTNNNGHWPVKSAGVQYKLKEFLDPNIAGINAVTNDTKQAASGSWYTTSGAQTTQPSQKGLYINGNRKVIVR